MWISNQMKMELIFFLLSNLNDNKISNGNKMKYEHTMKCKKFYNYKMELEKWESKKLMILY